MNPITLSVFVGLTCTILGGAIVVLFQIWVQTWIESKKNSSLKAIKAAEDHSIRSNLPNRDYIEFVGRQQALKIAMRILGPEHRIGVLTIDGIGGIGKTTLALEVAHRCREKDMFDTIIWMSAKREVLTPQGIVPRQQSFSNFDDLFAIAARVLKYSELLSVSSEEKLHVLQHLFSQERILLILDNLEVVDDERVNEFLRELPIPSKVIVTTRHRINVAYDIRLVGMSLEESMILMRHECEKKSFRLGDESLKRLYHRTGGIPLAMVWCVAQISGKGRTLSAVLDSLAQPHDDVCRFCFQESFKLLERDEQKTLFALSLLNEPTKREIIGLIAGLEKNPLIRDEALAKLVQLSLASQKGDIFDMLSLARLYARATLEQSPILEQETKERWVRQYIARGSALVPVTVYFPINVPGELETCIQRLVHKFNSMGIGIYVLPIFTGRYSQTNELLQQALAHGPVPDVAILGIDMWLEIVAKGLLLPLDRTVVSGGQEYLIESGFETSFLFNTTYRERLYGIPFSRSFPVIYYNRDIFERIGIDNSDASPLKWPDWIEYAKHIYRAKQSQSVHSFLPISLPLEDWALSCFTRQVGGRLIDDEDFKPLVNSKEAVEALEFWTTLCKLGLAKADDPWLQAPLDFVHGRSAMLFHTSGSLRFLASNANFEVGVWPLPYQSTPAAEIGGANFTILADRPKEQQKAAWQFIEWFTQPEQSVEWAIGTGYLPVHNHSYQLPLYRSYMNSQPGSEVAILQRDRAYPRTSAPYFARLTPHIYDALSETLRGNRTPKESLTRLQDTAIRLADL